MALGCLASAPSRAQTRCLPGPAPGWAPAAALGHKGQVKVDRPIAPTPY
eukprot:COSAG05_NODE_627_length_8245_cov_3.788485_6_plen_49_part_00